MFLFFGGSFSAILSIRVPLILPAYARHHANRPTSGSVDKRVANRGHKGYNERGNLSKKQVKA